MAGLDAGAIDRTGHDLAHWERVVDAIIYLLLQKGVMADVAQLRTGIEELGPDVYERLTYYERWAASAAKACLDAGVVTGDELQQRIAAVRERGGRLMTRRFPDRPAGADRRPRRAAPPPRAGLRQGPHPAPLCTIAPNRANPSSWAMAARDPRRHPVYRVRLRQPDLWTDFDGVADDSIEIEIFEHWLHDAEAITP